MEIRKSEESFQTQWIDRLVASLLATIEGLIMLATNLWKVAIKIFP